LAIDTPFEFFIKSGHAVLGLDPTGMSRLSVIGLIPHIGKLQSCHGTVHDVLVVIGSHPGFDVRKFEDITFPSGDDLLRIGAPCLL